MAEQRLLRDPRRPGAGDPGRDQEGLPAGRAQVPPGPEPREPGGRGAVQGSGRGLQRPHRPGEKVRLRPVRAGRAEGPGRSGVRPVGVQGFRGHPREFLRVQLRRSLRRQGQAPGGRPQRGRDLALELEIGLDEAALGAEKEVKLTRHERCPACDGSKLRPGTQKTACPACQGRGQIRYQQGFFTVSRTCSHCRGAGEIIASPCGTCQGTGQGQGQDDAEDQDPGRHRRRHHG